MKYFYLIILLFALGCNPIPKKDKHPEVPMLAELLKDQTKFRKVADLTGLSEIIILNDNRIFLKPDNSKAPFKIIDVDKNIIFEHLYDWKLPFYIDKQANLYFNRKKFFHPDYQKQTDFKTVVFADSVSKKFEELNHLNDSLRLKATEKYELEILKPYGLKPCEYSIVNTASCNVFKVVNETLIVRQTELFKSELSVRKFEVSKFDDDILIGWRNGRLPSPDYLAYYQLNKQRFKCDNMILPTTVTLNGKLYLFTPGLGLYQILF